MQQGLLKASVAEMIGTFLLTLIGAGTICALRFQEITGAGSQSSPLVLIAFAHGLALMVAIYATAHISGGAINPAVSLGFWIAGRLSLVAAVVYTIFQCVGAIIAAFLLRAIFWKWGAEDDAVRLGMTFTNQVSQMKAALVEGTLTFVLMFAIMACMLDPNRRGRQMFGVCVGMTLAICMMAGAPVTGAALNPARYLGPAVAYGYLGQAGVYLIAPLVGAAIAAALYRFVFMTTGPAPEDEV
jgi:aquaporin TIP